MNIDRGARRSTPFRINRPVILRAYFVTFRFRNLDVLFVLIGPQLCLILIPNDHTKICLLDQIAKCCCLLDGKKRKLARHIRFNICIYIHLWKKKYLCLIDNNNCSKNLCCLLDIFFLCLLDDFS